MIWDNFSVFRPNCASWRHMSARIRAQVMGCFVWTYMLLLRYQMMRAWMLLSMVSRFSCGFFTVMAGNENQGRAKRRTTIRAGPTETVWCKKLGSTNRLILMRRFSLLPVCDGFLKKFYGTPIYINKQPFSWIFCFELKKLWGEADPVQTKHQLFETKLFIQRGHAME